MATKPLTERVLIFADELIFELEDEHHCTEVPDYRAAWERLSAEFLAGKSSPVTLTPEQLHRYLHGSDQLEAESCRRVDYGICRRRIEAGAGT